MKESGRPPCSRLGGESMRVFSRDSVVVKYRQKRRAKEEEKLSRRHVNRKSWKLEVEYFVDLMRAEVG